jgi:hypothetical protein
MKLIAQELETFISQHYSSLKSLDESQFTNKPSPEKWSGKEVIGHLIDSAQNNIRRFVVAQYEQNPTINYNQVEWVAISNYQ